MIPTFLSTQLAALTPTLAQLGDFINPPVPPLPEPPLLERLLFEDPLIPAVGLVVAGVIVLIALRHTAAKKALAGLAAAVLVAGAVFLTGTFVETERERLLRLQDELVDAVAFARIGEVDALLAPDARVRGVSLPMLRGGLDRDGILATIRATLGSVYKVGTVGTIERQAVIDGPNAARTQVYLRVAGSGTGSTWTWFRIAWRLEPDGEWRAFDVEPLFISGVLPYNG